jgi:hypothetical protein
MLAPPPNACEPSPSTPTASSVPSKRTPPISNLCKPNAKAAHAQALENAILLTQLAEANGETYDPAPDFPSTA